VLLPFHLRQGLCLGPLQRAAAVEHAAHLLLLLELSPPYPRFSDTSSTLL
jgi:hypothetical protein